MNIYDEVTHEIIAEADPEKGRTYPGKYQTGVEPEHLETVEGLRHIVPEMPIYEDCLYYHAYTNGELVERCKAELRSLDYIGVKIATGRATREEYAQQIARMDELAQRINELEGEWNE